MSAASPLGSEPHIIPLPDKSNQISLFNDDCLRVLKSLDSQSIDVIVTSPPYNLGIEYNQYRDDRPLPEYLSWVREWLTELRRVLATNGSLFLNVGSRPKDPARPFEVLAEARNLFELQNVIHWVKSIAIMKSEVGKGYEGLTDDIVV